MWYHFYVLNNLSKEEFMGIIIDVFGREILDSRGNPTVEDK